MTTVVWFRNDLRLDDHAPLCAAAEAGAVVPLFVWSPADDGKWPIGAASRWWLHYSLERLAASLSALGSRLIIRRGATRDVLCDVVREVNATSVMCMARFEPAARAIDRSLDKTLSVPVRRFEAALFAPADIRTGTNKPYQVFTPFARNCRMQAAPPRPMRRPKTLVAPQRWPRSEALTSLALVSRVDWAKGLRGAWTPGEHGGQQALQRFLKGALRSYSKARDEPAVVGTSRLSPHLHFGEISPRRVWHAIGAAIERGNALAFSTHAEKFRSELLWREFAQHALFHFPHTESAPLRADFVSIPWRHDRRSLHAWQRGATGYPIVDAGMRELWHTGWMHNRVRMVVASVLVKHLLIPWQEGARWFWETLVDADLANNSMGWQWAAGCGADAAPYFRIFNPELQGKKFDGQGTYVRQWVPEVAALPDRFIHAPWKASPAILARAGVVLGKSYPRPIVDHARARARALEAFARMLTLTAPRQRGAKRRRA